MPRAQVHFKPPWEQLGTMIIVTGLPSRFLCIFLQPGWVFSHLGSYKKLAGKGLSSVSAVSSPSWPVLIVFAALRASLPSLCPSASVTSLAVMTFWFSIVTSWDHICQFIKPCFIGPPCTNKVHLNIFYKERKWTPCVVYQIPWSGSAISLSPGAVTGFALCHHPMGSLYFLSVSMQWCKLFFQTCLSFQLLWTACHGQCWREIWVLEARSVVAIVEPWPHCL